MAELDTSASFGGATEQPSKRERLVSEGKERASEVTDKAKHAAFSRIDQRKGDFVQSLDRLAHSLDEFGEGSTGPESRVASTVAGYLRRAKGAIENRSTDELASMAVSEIRQRPGAVIAGAFAIGFLSARLLKS